MWANGRAPVRPCQILCNGLKRGCTEKPAARNCRVKILPLWTYHFENVMFLARKFNSNQIAGFQAVLVRVNRAALPQTIINPSEHSE
jgi:hypothetical protein